MHVLRLSNEGRIEKTEKLYQFMTSDKASQLWNQIADATNELEAIDKSERIGHEKIWGRRGDLNLKLKQTHRSFAEAIDRVIGATGSETPP